MKNLDKYNKIFIKTFGIKKTKLTKLKYQSINSWDSVGHMNLMSALKLNLKLN